jgi:ABC-type antimicrobial peptide transport system permease subunit
MAFGAQPHDVTALIIRQSMAVVAIGLAAGLAAALSLTQFLASLLYGVEPADSWTLASVSLVLIGVALLATYLPARRAAKVDPMTALRCE